MIKNTGIRMKITMGLICLLLSGCYNTLHYGYLPGGDYQYYAPLSPVDLKGERFRLEVIDNREGFNISCSNFRIDRNTELEGSTGFDFFSAYVRAMIEENKGIVDQTSNNIIRLELSGLSAEYQGYGYVRVYGLVEFHAALGDFHRAYCSQMADGDDGAPVGKYSFDTRKGALRKMVSGATRRALEEFMHDLVDIQKNKGLHI
jgi:hypothetical protein